MNASSSGSESDDGEVKRLQEAVDGVSFLLKSELIQKKPSKRIKDDSDFGPTRQLVSKDMQTFLAKKLTEYLDSQCQYTSDANTTTSKHDKDCSNMSRTFGATEPLSQVKLLASSKHPLDHKSQMHTKSTKRKAKGASAIHRKKLRLQEGDSSCDSSDSEAEREEQLKLQAAAIEPETILKANSRK